MLLDVLGPWPWYILGLEGVAPILFVMFYSHNALAGEETEVILI